MDAMPGCEFRASRRAAGASGPDACPVRVLIRGAPPGVFPFESHDHEKIRIIHTKKSFTAGRGRL